MFLLPTYPKPTYPKPYARSFLFCAVRFAVHSLDADTFRVLFLLCIRFRGKPRTTDAGQEKTGSTQAVFVFSCCAVASRLCAMSLMKFQEGTPTETWAPGGLHALEPRECTRQRGYKQAASFCSCVFAGPLCSRSLANARQQKKGSP